MIKRTIFYFIRIITMCFILVTIFNNENYYFSQMGGLDFYKMFFINLFSEQKMIDIFKFLLIFSLYVVAYYRSIILLATELQDIFVIIKFHCSSKISYSFKILKYIVSKIIIDWVVLFALLCTTLSISHKTTGKDILYIGLEQLKLLVFFVLLAILIVLYIKSKAFAYSIIIFFIGFYVLFSKWISIEIFIGIVIGLLAIIYMEMLYKRGKYK